MTTRCPCTRTAPGPAAEARTTTAVHRGPGPMPGDCSCTTRAPRTSAGPGAPSRTPAVLVTAPGSCTPAVAPAPAGPGPSSAIGAPAAPAPEAAPRTPPARPAPRSRWLRRGVVALAAAGLAVLPAAPAHADGIRPQQWGLDALNTQEAWRTTKGSGVTVAVLDTGVDEQHRDLVGNVLPGKDLIGFGARRGERPWARHGTAMAGIIAAHGHGAEGGEGVMGIAPEAKILPVRVILESGDRAREKARKSRGTALAEGIRWAADQGADVINLSLGDDSESAHAEAREDAAVQYALAKGAVIVASAGNGGEKGDRVSYPAAYPGVIAVTAVDRFGARAAFSTRRWYATVNAPGVDVVIPDPDGKYYQGWGTSAAAAFVSGAVALVRSAHPGLTPAQIKKLLADTARDRPEGGRDDAKGYGMVDPAAAIEAGAELRGADPKSATSGYAGQYFGPGPRPAPPAAEPSDWLAPIAGGTGALVLACAMVLWRGSRENER